MATNGQEESRRLQDFVRRVGDLREVFGPVDIRYEWSLAVIQAAWELVLEAARDLTRRGHAEFSRAQLLDEVLRRDPSRVPQSLGPVIQGNDGQRVRRSAKPVWHTVGAHRTRSLPTAHPVVGAHTFSPAVGGAGNTLRSSA